MDVFSKKETIFATEYHNGMEDAWIVKDFADINEGYTLPRIFNSEKDAKKYIKNLDYSRQCRESGRKPHSYSILTEYCFSPIK